jgi:radical SAM superfamily enzyme YgiQ (UPF0313 family)
MRLCLVAPPTAEFFEDGSIAQSRVAREVAEQTPLGILSLASVLEKRGIDTHILDLNWIHFRRSWPDPYHYRRVDFCSLAISELANLTFDVIGLSTMCSTYPLSLRIAREIKKRLPETVVILGGPQASVVDEATLDAFSFVDIVVRGEAEESFPLLLNALDEGSSLGNIAGITFRNGGRVVRNPSGPVITNLDDLPLPAFHLYSRIKDCNYIPIEIGRGCPFACTFCSTNDFFRRRFRLKSPARLIEQMCSLEQEYGVSRFELVHDMFTVDRRRVVEFCEAFLNSGKKFTWSCSARTDSVDNELLSLMAEAGCRGIFFGVETGSQRMQKIIHKNLDIAKAERLLESTGSAGIKTTVAFIDGFPEEQKEDLAASVDFIMNAAGFDHVSPQINILAPLAKTPLLDQYRDQLVLDEVYSDMSHQGWRQDAGDLELISAYPEIFPNFYGVPCDIGRAYVSEFNKFLMNALSRFRWLLIALHQQSGQLLSVFDSWLAWRGIIENPSKYYCTFAFSCDFKKFLREAYLKRESMGLLGVKGLLAYYEALDAALSPAGESVAESPGKEAVIELSQDSIPKLTNGTCVLPLAMDVKSIIENLRSRTPITDEVVSETILAARDAKAGEVELYKIPPLSAIILQLCDGDRDVRGILRQFSKHAGMVEQEQVESVCLEGLALLNRYSLIRFERRVVGRPNVKRQPVLSGKDAEALVM